MAPQRLNCKFSVSSSAARRAPVKTIQKSVSKSVKNLPGNVRQTITNNKKTTSKVSCQAKERVSKVSNIKTCKKKKHF